MTARSNEAGLRATIAAQQQQIAKLEAERERLRKLYEKALFELEKMRRGLVGPKSEKLRVAEEQLSLLETLMSALPPASAPPAEPAAPPGPEPRSRPKPKRQTPHGRRKPEDLSHLPVLVMRMEPALSDQEREGAEEIGIDVSESLEYKPAGYVRLRTERPKYRIRSGNGTRLVQAEPIVRGIARCLAAPSLCAHVLVQKYADHIPLHRQEKIFRRHDLTLARSTLSDWVQGSHALLRHIVKAMWDDARRSPWVGIDATGILIQSSEQCRRKSFFVLVAARDHVLYHAAEREDRFEPVALLGGYEGYVIADASAIYHELYRQNDGITEVGCWSHARRKFFDALASDKQGATRGLVLIGRLYEANAQTRKQDDEWHAESRAELARPILDELYAWVAKVQATPDDKSPLRLALNYLNNHREPLTRFLGDGRLRLDNNLSELALRRQVIGRKNWLFCGSDEAAHWNTTIVSLIASCELHELEPWAYLRDVLTLLPTWPQQAALELAPKYWAATRARPDVLAKLQQLDLLTWADELDPDLVKSAFSQATA